MTPNQIAFLAMISHSEGTDRQADPYRCCFGFEHIIADLSDHPAITGEWLGVSIAFLGPQYAHSISTAAGKYQITKPTWIEGKRVLRLPNFGPVAQDDFALWLIKEKGALELVNIGDLEHAIWLCAPVWASLPGSLSGQPQRTMDSLVDVFGKAGGTLVA